MTIADDLREVKEESNRLRSELDTAKGEITLLREQVLGERGLSATITAQTTEIRGLRKAAYWVAGLIVAGAISFAFSVLVLIPQ